MKLKSQIYDFNFDVYDVNSKIIEFYKLKLSIKSESYQIKKSKL